MTIGGTDLNLLLALEVLLEEGNVTRAGRRLQMGQPAMSGFLARLRRRFDDELLVRNGRDFERTPFATELLPEVQAAVRRINRALQVGDSFDPLHSEHVFRLTMSDYAISVLHQPLLSRIERLAPGIRLEIEPLGRDVRGSEQVLVDYDVMVGPLGSGFVGISRPLWRDRMVCLVDPQNPGAQKGYLTLADVTRLPHAVASFGRGIWTPVDRALGEQNIARRIQVRVYGWLPLPFVIEGTDLLAIVPERLARLHAQPNGPLLLVEPPFGHVVLAEAYWYAANRQTDPAHAWLFEQLDEVGAALTQTNPPDSLSRR